MKKSIGLFILFSLSTLTIANPTALYAQSLDSDNNIKNPSNFQKTDISLIYDIKNKSKENNRKKNDDDTPKKIKMTPKEIRLEIVRNSIKKMVLKNSTSNSVLGGVIGAVATAQPAGLLLGGVAGILQGKSMRYEEAQAKLHKMEKAILASEDYELTAEEIRLAAYSEVNLFEFLALSSSPITIKVNTGKPKRKPPQLSQHPINNCYGYSSGESDASSISRKRLLASKCLYNMN
ncbi:hypothetical protein A9Q81_19060 [Gammaproteobacteria bacterium 42_54_T18]|nr:hypothetical protein A9Q81_19060 [Gammaproteobacteria bacterium 42_54_T18]